ncbi:hypothetical protein GCM10007897_06240 [Sphingobium jiangsuense]|uniref:Uncharacterized protein n=1 Tax=Sphingobium jiangsuense TaxID=870476 RepID=A0A7W6BFX4_9SPHN|nr:hypothetical protein [Sphingobium jiangsuense]MBB3925309.1 hypothetical protein [Sphingobium jiangsuense]GLS99245.1 hypothetical protein GCM10007897_06240 [Sphingobium jiangsuense]
MSFSKDAMGAVGVVAMIALGTFLGMSDVGGESIKAAITAYGMLLVYIAFIVTLFVFAYRAVKKSIQKLMNKNTQ